MQYFDFSKSNHQLSNESKIVDNNSANIEKQVFNIYIYIGSKVLFFLLFLISCFVIFYSFAYYQKQQQIKEKEEKIRILIEEKSKIVNQKFDREKAKKEIEELLILDIVDEIKK